MMRIVYSHKLWTHLHSGALLTQYCRPWEAQLRVPVGPNKRQQAKEEELRSAF